MNHSYNQPHHDGENANGMQHSFHPQGGYYYGQTNEEVNHASGWYEVSCVEAGVCQGSGDAIRTIAYDPIKELIWAGTASGMLHSHYAEDMSRVVSTYISEPSPVLHCGEDVRDIVVSKSSVLAAVGYGLAVLTRGGVLQSSFRADAVRDAKAISLSPVSETHVCIGGESRMLAVLDLEHQRILRQASLRGASGVTDAAWVSPEGASSLAIFSTATGRISFCDPATMREVNALAAFTGPATSITSSGFYLATTGLGTRGGVPYLEPHVKMFDIRAVGTPLPPVIFPSPPMFVEFDMANGAFYNTNCALWVLSPDGVLQLLDVSGLANGSLPYPLSEEIRLDAGTDVLTSIAVSSNGLLALGDSGGFIHQWSSAESTKVNENSEPIWTAPITTEPPTPSVRLNELLTSEIGTTIPKCAIPEFNNGYLTDQIFAVQDNDLSEHRASRTHAIRTSKGVDPTTNLYQRMPHVQFPLMISDEILRNAKHQSFVGYAQAPNSFVRNSQSGHKDPPIVRAPRNVSNRWPRYVTNSASDNASRAGDYVQRGKVDFSKPYAKSQYVEMDLVARESIEGFDFIKYNQSKLFCGLENALPNVYVNAAVQVLYFSTPIRKAIAAHSCDRDWCISCELGFLFHMFDLGGAGMACESGNFTRAFMTMANADALGLLDGPHALPLSHRIENFTRYLLEQLRKDEDMQNESTVDSVFGAETSSFGVFTPSETSWERVSRPFQHTLMYDPDQPEGSTFCELVEHSLSYSLEPTRAFCEAKGQFETMSHRRQLRELPNVLLLGSNTKSPQYRRYWFEKEDISKRSMNGEESPDDDVISEDEAALHEAAEKAMRRKKKLVQSMRIDLSNGITVSEVKSDGDIESHYGYNDNEEINGNADMGPLTAEYDLSFVIAHVPPSCLDLYASGGSRGCGKNAGGHLVSYIRVPREYRKRDQGGTKAVGNDSNAGCNWWCFNDFVISPCDGFDEVAAFDRRWKKPCLVGYVRRDVRNRVKSEKIVAPLDIRNVIGSDKQNAATGLQATEATPGKGTILALDCEFVMVGRDEADIFGDGTRKVVIPRRMALARVSVVRGDGALKGTALIDDYVAVREPVVDYVTRFSGLEEGDLDATRSKHKVSSLKSVYKRLRCLVDAGCVFVGHGLKSDFRIINFVVPPEQVIDTVTLFRVKNKRLLGLRFLSNTLLGGDIQAETHDSIEDSDAALRLYELYLRLRSGENGESRLQKTVKELYTYGYAHGWKMDKDDPFVIDWEAEG